MTAEQKHNHPISVVVVHGTGVRHLNQVKARESVLSASQEARVSARIEFCDWGDAFGSEFEGRCIPADAPDAPGQHGSQISPLWARRLDNPFLELEMLALPHGGAENNLTLIAHQECMGALDRIDNQPLSDNLTNTIARSGLADTWDISRKEISQSELAREAVIASAEHGEIPLAAEAIGAAIIANAYNMILGTGGQAFSFYLADTILDMFLRELQFRGYGIANLLLRPLQAAATSIVRRRRSAIMRSIAAPIGDILLYQSRGQEIRRHISNSISKCKGNVIVVGHSLGGVASFESIIENRPSNIKALFTLGSQVSLLHEMGALRSITPAAFLPDRFPRWINIYDPSDFLSFTCRPFWTAVDDIQASSGLPFPESHSFYLHNRRVWSLIEEVVNA